MLLDFMLSWISLPWFFFWVGIRFHKFLALDLLLVETDSREATELLRLLKDSLLLRLSSISFCNAVFTLLETTGSGSPGSSLSPSLAYSWLLSAILHYSSQISFSGLWQGLSTIAKFISSENLKLRAGLNLVTNDFTWNLKKYESKNLIITVNPAPWCLMMALSYSILLHWLSPSFTKPMMFNLIFFLLT